MREEFFGYYKPKKDEFTKMWQEGIFVFDANVLLNIYRYSPQTRGEFFNILRQLKDRIWVPHQAAFEYFENRESVIAQQYAISDEIEGFLRNALKEVEARYTKGHPFANTSHIAEIIKKSIEEIKSAIQKAMSNSPNLLEEDILLDQITELFDEKVGQPYPKDKLKEVHAEAKRRIEEQIPPGFKDAKKDDERSCGDVVLWLQLLDFAKSRQKPIIFTTDDRKEDWWRRDKGKTIGPRPELVAEVHVQATVPFYMYHADVFMKRAQEFLGLQIQSEAIEEVREVGQQDEASYQYDQQTRELQELLELLNISEQVITTPGKSSRQVNLVTLGPTSGLFSFGESPIGKLRVVTSGSTPDLSSFGESLTGRVGLFTLGSTPGLPIRVTSDLAESNIKISGSTTMSDFNELRKNDKPLDDEVDKKMRLFSLHPNDLLV